MYSKRQPVASGGLLSTPKATVSKETQDLLKVMMKESQLTNFQMRQLDQKMKCGESLPLRCSPTSSATTKPTANKSSKNDKKSKKTSGLRTHSTIVAQQQQEIDPPFLPTRTCYNSSTEKERLQDLMAGTDKKSTQITKEHPTLSSDQYLDDHRSYDEIVQEITERQQFLEEMETLGQEREYRHKIMTEISQRMRELELLDKDKKC